MGKVLPATVRSWQETTTSTLPERFARGDADVPPTRSSSSTSTSFGETKRFRVWYYTFAWTRSSFVDSKRGIIGFCSNGRRHQQVRVGKLTITLTLDDK
jgi:hypothetical protein